MATLDTIAERRKEESFEADNENRNENDDDFDYDVNVSLSSLVSKRALQFSARFLKGFGSGLVVFSGIKVVTALMRNPFRERYGKKTVKHTCKCLRTKIR